jgi:hypothetical protein
MLLRRRTGSAVATDYYLIGDGLNQAGETFIRKAMPNFSAPSPGADQVR